MQQYMHARNTNTTPPSGQRPETAVDSLRDKPPPPPKPALSHRHVILCRRWWCQNVNGLSTRFFQSFRPSYSSLTPAFLLRPSLLLLFPPPTPSPTTTTPISSTMSFIETKPDSDFSIHNIPFGIISTEHNVSFLSSSFSSRIGFVSVKSAFVSFLFFSIYFGVLSLAICLHCIVLSSLSLYNHSPLPVSPPALATLLSISLFLPRPASLPQSSTMLRVSLPR